MDAKQQQTPEEKCEEKIREVDGELGAYRQLLGSSVEVAEADLERAEKRMRAARGEPRFVKVGSAMVEATDRLGALLEAEEALLKLCDLRGKDPVAQCEALLQRKLKLLRRLLKIRLEAPSS